MSAPVGKGLGEPRDGERLLYRGRASWNIEQGTFEGRTDKREAGGTLEWEIEHLAHTDHDGALRWLVDARLIGPPAGPDARPTAPRRPAGTSTPAPVPAPVVTPKPTAPTADVARAVLTAAVPADDTPGAAYLAARGTWPADGPPLPAAVRWLAARWAARSRR